MNTSLHLIIVIGILVLVPMASYAIYSYILDRKENKQNNEMRNKYINDLDNLEELDVVTKNRTKFNIEDEPNDEEYDEILEALREHGIEV